MDKYRKHGAILVAIFSIIGIIVVIVTFLNTTIIDDLIMKLAHNDIMIGTFASFVVAIFVSMYSYIIIKIIRRKKVGIFLSYAYSSKEDIEKIKNVLSSTSNYKIFDFDSILIGQNVQAEIKNIMDNSSIFVILLDGNYFQSNHCLMELETMIGSSKVIIPILKSSEYISKLPQEIKKIKCLVISEDETWETTFRQSLYEQYRKIRNK